MAMPALTDFDRRELDRRELETCAEIIHQVVQYVFGKVGRQREIARRILQPVEFLQWSVQQGTEATIPADVSDEDREKLAECSERMDAAVRDGLAEIQRELWRAKIVMRDDFVNWALAEFKFSPWRKVIGQAAMRVDKLPTPPKPEEPEAETEAPPLAPTRRPTRPR